AYPGGIFFGDAVVELHIEIIAVSLAHGIKKEIVGDAGTIVRQRINVQDVAAHGIDAIARNDVTGKLSAHKLSRCRLRLRQRSEDARRGWREVPARKRRCGDGAHGGLRLADAAALVIEEEERFGIFRPRIDAASDETAELIQPERRDGEVGIVKKVFGIEG